LSIVTPGSLVPAARGRPADDPIFALHAEAVGRAAAGESILNATLGTLSTEDGQLAVLPSVLETLGRIQGRSTAGYAPVAGSPDFLAATIADLFGDGPLARQAVAAATPGGTGAVYQSVVNFLEPGQKILTTSYHWGPYPSIAKNNARDAETFAMFRPDGSLDIDAFASALDRHVDTQRRALVVLNDPCHNPTGYSLRPDEWRRVADVLRAAGERAPVTVLLDVAYFRFGGASATTWVNAVPGLLKTTTVLIAWTASKTFTQYGARVGALVALHRSDEERTQIKNALSFTCRSTWSNCNHLGQDAFTELMTVPELRRRSDAERDELSALLQRRIDAFNAAATAEGLRTPRFDSGFFCTVFTRDGEKTAAKMRDLGVYVLPLRGGVRVGLCSTPLADIPRLVDALKQGVAAAA
jgi:aromatic-amino-acid transaminase